jgi:hypothetical protein
MPVNTMFYRHSISYELLLCRDDWIRTSDLLHPMQMRYRAALRPETFETRGTKILEIFYSKK